MSTADDGTTEVHRERFKARAWWDASGPQNAGWCIEYQTAAGDCVDDSQKIWHPPIDQLGPNDGDAIRELAASYLLKIEGTK